MNHWFLYRIHSTANGVPSTDEGFVLGETDEQALHRVRNIFGETFLDNIEIEQINAEEWGGHEALSSQANFGFILPT